MKESFMIPVVVLIVSIICYKIPHGNISNFYGYRTPTSKKSIEAWKEGNRYSSKLIIKCSLLSILINIITLVVIKVLNGEEAIATFISSIMTIALIIVSIIMTEIHLKKMFG